MGATQISSISSIKVTTNAAPAAELYCATWMRAMLHASNPMAPNTYTLHTQVQEQAQIHPKKEKETTTDEFN